ncbi:hypothetical protein LIA77_07790 [Sarocladium implicatum]|nr:hypothetical protein LIA77_07790 [Sarocladium implicatum]
MKPFAPSPSHISGHMNGFCLSSIRHGKITCSHGPINTTAFLFCQAFFGRAAVGSPPPPSSSNVQSRDRTLLGRRATSGEEAATLSVRFQLAFCESMHHGASRASWLQWLSSRILGLDSCSLDS